MEVDQRTYQDLHIQVHSDNYLQLPLQRHGDQTPKMTSGGNAANLRSSAYVHYFPPFPSFHLTKAHYCCSTGRY